MNLHDLPPTLDDPVETLLAFHRRIERGLADLGRLATCLDAGEMDVSSSATAASLLRLFGELVPRHHADEEHDLVPILHRRIAYAEERDAFETLRGRLEGDHRELRESWRRLRVPLGAVAEGVERRLPLDLVQYFRAVQAIHISAEEGVLHRVALRWLKPGDRFALARRMQERRSSRHGTVTAVTRD